MAGRRFEGTSLDEALAQAGSSLGVERYQIRYHVVTEKRGFLGGIKRVVIEAEVLPDAQPPQTSESPRAAFDSPSPRSQQGQGERKRGRERSRRGPRSDAPRGRSRQPESRHPRRDVPVEPLPPQGAESIEATKVRQWFEEVIDLTRLDLEFRTTESESEIRVLLGGRDGSLLLDRGGELLDSFQVLVNKALVGRVVEKLIELDCEGFKEQRTHDIEARALEAAKQVALDGREHVLPAMTPVERRIVHLALSEHESVATESRGEGFFKRVAIVPKGQQPEASSGA